MKCRAVLGLALAPVVQAGSGYVGMAEPFLDLGNVTLVIERVRRCRGTPFSVSGAGASSNLRAWASPSAGVLLFF